MELLVYLSCPMAVEFHTVPSGAFPRGGGPGGGETGLAPAAPLVEAMIASGLPSEGPMATGVEASPDTPARSRCCGGSSSVVSVVWV